MAENAVEVSGLAKSYGRVRALKGISLSIKAGVVTALVGANGAGKTTLLKILAGLLPADAGSAAVFGVDVAAEPRQAHALTGFLPDFYGMYGDMAAADYLRYFALAYRLPDAAIESRINTLLAQTGLSGKAGEKVKGLSRGMRQRLALARALVQDPPLLLLDEPASGLDPRSRIELQELLRSLAKAGKTIVVSSHILAELESYCTHVIMLQEGAVIACGAVVEVGRTVSPGTVVRVRSAGAPAAILSALAGFEGVSGAREDGKGGVQFAFSGGEVALAGVLKKLIETGVQVTYFVSEGGTIADAYMAITGGKK